jgi:hypothetical protein
VIIDPNYYEELRLLKQKVHSQAYLEFKGFTVAPLGTSLPTDKGEEVTVPFQA